MKDNWLTDEEVKRVLNLTDEEVKDENKTLVTTNGKEEENEEHEDLRKPVDVYPVQFQSFEENEENQKFKNEFKNPNVRENWKKSSKNDVPTYTFTLNK